MSTLTPQQLAQNLNQAQINQRLLMSNILDLVVAESKDVTPVDTGTLRRSITREVIGSGEKGMVGANVYYGVYVHEGTRYQRANPFLANGLTNSLTRVNQLIEREGLRLLSEIVQ